ncbi:unnamed protein product [Periconia digitata]|uniref:BZIP domain-containing protein n=1 Tax=Periconia digitata TaxID=1303443 RepID=A0A9W4U6B2_9PLEO|nr:unnamed protein product [Periconia digitata]
MPSPPHTPPAMADVNERRKAQNRAAQKKYRTRQKLRIDLARAILCEKPHQQNDIATDALAATLEQYGLPFDLDGGSTRNTGSTDSSTTTATTNNTNTTADDIHSLDPSLGRLDWMHSSGDSNSCNGAMSSSNTPPLALSPSDIDNFILMSPASHRMPSLSSASVSDWPGSVVAHDECTEENTSYINSSSSSTASTTILDETSSPLYTAITLGNIEMARLLVRSGAKLDLPDRNGDTWLHHCVRRGDITTASAILDLGANILHTTAGGRTPLHLAVTTGNEAMVSMLLDWCMNAKDPPGAALPTPLTSAASPSPDPTSTASTMVPTHSNAVRTLSGRRSSLLAHIIDACDAHNMTALHLSVKLQRIEILKTLLEYGANVM